MTSVENEIESNKEQDMMLCDKKENTIKNCPQSFFSKQPPDSGYSWVILIAGFILMILVASTGSLFGLIFIHKIKALNMSTLSVALSFNFRSFIWNVASTMSGPLCDLFGWRKVAVSGALLCSFSVLLTCYATSILAINAYFALFTGFGGGLAFSTCLFVLSNYFVKMRGLALAIMGSGFGTGQLILPFFIRYLQEHYGFHGAALIFSAFLLNTIVAAAFFHPIEWHQGNGRLHDKIFKSGDDLIGDNLLSHVEGSITSTRSNLVKSLSQFYVILRKVLKMTYRNIRNLRSPVVAIISVSGGCKIVAFLNIMLMLPLSFLNKGLTLQQAAYCISTTGTAILVFRLITPIMSDLKFVNVTCSYILGQLLVAISCFVFTFVSSFSHIAICFGFFGAGVGSSMGLQPIIFIDYKGLKELPQTYGTFGFVNAILFILVGTLFGYIRDVTGSYTLMYRLFSGVLLFSSLVWIFMPCALSYERKYSERNLDDH